MSDPLWYKDAIIYEAHVRGFYDSNGDGIGDFTGLTQKLPYLHDLGITCLWLLPFYPSPLRDDGYDIADYTSINPIYGTLEDFKRFVATAHDLRIRVLTELVVNHTSDQHPWFQRARRAPRGSPEREYYVWSDDDTKYAGTRIIFTDTEKSNWTFDPVAGQYYWHRFFSHQPDLNLENPEVLRAILEVMRFWFDLGVDAMRLDAIPYLVEREGTINENLPETHAVLKHIRREVDRRYEGRPLLAEANQWPSDVQAYFGEGDECHMAFHFPLMPRMFMALQQEDRHPIVEILNQTPEIPPNCQWAIFLRNHDELTLEMVTDEERDYMYAQYAADPQMRLNVGIRRRLAPLMENSRPRIELLHSLLFSMPGTPIVYYGDEIGMGDNVYLGDRNGVRTPMQWSSDRNAGFSRSDPARLYAPVIMDPLYGYEAINVEAQERSPHSLLHWMKRMIVYVRRYEQELILCVANLARTVQPAEIPLTEFAGLTPVEMLGQTEFPRIGEQPYVLTLAPYGFYWFELRQVVAPVTARIAPPAETQVEVPSLLAGVVWDSILDGGLRSLLERRVLAQFLQRQRWFSGKARDIASIRIADWTTIRRGHHPAFVTLVNVTYGDGLREEYLLPLAMASDAGAAAIRAEHPFAVVAQITGARKGILYDGLLDDEVGTMLLALVQGDGELRLWRGVIRGVSEPIPERVPADPATPITRGPADQSNTSVLFGKRYILKLFRRIEPGEHPDLEMNEVLVERGFTRVPPLGGALWYEESGAQPCAIAMLQQYLHNQGNGWQVTVDELGRYFERVLTRPSTGGDGAESGTPSREGPRDGDDEAIGVYLTLAAALGRRTGEMHARLADTADLPDFAPEPLTAADLQAMRHAMRRHAIDQLDLLERSMPSLDARQRLLAGSVLDAREDLLYAFDALSGVRDPGIRIRCHGDFHLGQVLVTEGDVVILDFEGEPSRPLEDRRGRHPALRDVAGMLRSFNYAALTALNAATITRPEDLERLAPWTDAWEGSVVRTFLREYRSAAAMPIVPLTDEDFDRLLVAFLVDKALYELAYELNSRPDWVQIPVLGLLRLHAHLRSTRTSSGTSHSATLR